MRWRGRRCSWTNFSSESSDEAFPVRPRPALLSLALLTAGCGYNTIQTMDEKVNQAKGQIETQLQRRADLIPNLVETVKGVAKQESTVFTQHRRRARPAAARCSRATWARWPPPTRR